MKLVISFLLIAGAVSLAIPASAQSYTVTDLGTLPGDDQSVGSALNSAGQVVGGTGSAVQHGFFWSAKQGMLSLPPLPGGFFSVASGINDSDLIAGSSTIHGWNTDHAVLWMNGKVQDLGALPGGNNSIASAINAVGQVAGGSDSATTDTHAMLWSNTSGMQDLGVLGPAGGYSLAFGVNRYGEVVGYSSTTSGTVFHAFVWTKAHGMRDLGTLPGGTNSSANGVNDLGQIAGSSDCGSSCIHAVLWTPNGRSHDLGVPANSTASVGNGINSLGQVVGYAYSGAVYHGFVWSQTAGMQDLNGLIPADSGWTIEFAFAINNNGQITGRGSINGQIHAFLLTPVATAGRP